ncbi:MAG: GntR family transcriptional regulator [Gammaproteobacteria bacterium]|nr:GntR family transcriptional regulator [Gammaproteobacteria bacterium]
MNESTTATNPGDALEQPTLARRCFDSIKADIISGQLAQDTKIVESDLALKYGISRGPLREAIHRLERIKLIVRIPHAGSRVVILNSKMMEDIYIAREALEGMAARLAARLMSEDEIAALSDLLDDHADSISETEGRAYFQREGDIDFHYRIAVASQNQWILDNLHGELYQLIRMCRHQSGRFPARAQMALDQHRQIANAIARRDEELAEILMRRHISGAWEIVKQILEDQND